MVIRKGLLDQGSTVVDINRCVMSKQVCHVKTGEHRGTFSPDVPRIAVITSCNVRKMALSYFCETDDTKRVMYSGVADGFSV